ncbi:MAG: very short patch repair endonuclease [Phycisphaerae bacterium]|nr:very short patch repair endonuclease [Phycisphaerae bacterium]
MDTFTKKKRSEIMSKIRSKNTKAELIIFKELRKKGIYFQKHYKNAVGKPDIALPRKKIAIFIDGDFWHGYRFNKIKNKLPKKYWLKKIEDNIKRDKKGKALLHKKGWRTLRLWEHEIINDIEESINKILDFISR